MRDLAHKDRKMIIKLKVFLSNINGGLGFFTLSCTDSKLVMLQAVPLPPQSILPYSLENKNTPSVNAQCTAFAK